MAAAAGRLDRLVWAIEVAGRYAATTCLTKALALQWLLAGRGIPTRLWLGVERAKASGDDARPEPLLRAHAWLEHDGRVIVGGPAPAGYAPLVCLAGGPAAFAKTAGVELAR